MDHKRYAYRIVWSDEDQEFVGLCTEFPSLSWLHATSTRCCRQTPSPRATGGIRH